MDFNRLARSYASEVKCSLSTLSAYEGCQLHFPGLAVGKALACSIVPDVADQQDEGSQGYGEPSSRRNLQSQKYCQVNRKTDFYELPELKVKLDKLLGALCLNRERDFEIEIRQP